MTVHLDSGLSRSKAHAHKVAEGMQCVLLSRVVQDRRIIYDPDDTAVPEDRPIVEAYKTLIPVEQDKTFAWCCRIVLKKQQLRELNLSIDNIVTALRVHVGDKAIVMASQVDSEEYVVRIRPFNLKQIDKLDITDEEQRNLEEIAVTDMCDVIIETARISGLSSVSKTFVKHSGGEYIIETEGSNLLEIMSSGNAMDPSKILSNNVHDILPILGVEAATTVVFVESNDVLTNGGDGILFRHLELLSLKMNLTGQPVPVTRHGMAKAKHGVLLRASFERTVDTFVDAAVHSAKDPCNGICESIVMGQVPPMGTGFIDIVQPEKKNEPTVQQHALEKKRPVSPDEFVGRRKRRKITEFAPTWDFCTDPVRRFNLFKIKQRVTENTAAFTPPPMEPSTPPFEYWGPTSPSPGPNTPMTPPMEDEINTPPDTPPPSPTAFEPRTPVWYSATSPEFVPESPVEPPTESANNAEWSVRLMSPSMATQDGLQPWVAQPMSPKYIS